jgi:hypothetical protein
MISIKNSFLFVHIPKTGGNSIQQILMNYSEDFVVSKTAGQDGLDRFNVVNEKYHTKKHSPLWYYKLMLPRSLYSDLFKFAIIRNPWDRAISYYFSPHRKVTEWNRDQFLSTLEEVKPVGDYVRTIHPILSDVKNRLNLPGKPLNSDMDYIMRFENLEDDFRIVCEKINIPFQALNHRNRSDHNHYSIYYDSELLEIVRSKYREEIVWGGYEFERK